MVEFPQLSSVSLKSLPSLTGFYPGSQTLERLQPGDFDHPLFNEKVAFPRLEVLEISHVDVRRIWDNQLPVNSFENLREMRMTFCQKLFNVVPTSMLKRFKSLQFLSAANCDSLEVVFDLEGMSVLEDVTSIQLRKLVLDDLPKLKHIWTRNPHGFFIFQNLDSVQALSCPMLKNVFPGSEGLGQDILHLEKHLLKFCEMNETADKNGLGEAPGSVFSCVDEISECTSGEPIKDSNSRILMKGRIHP